MFKLFAHLIFVLIGPSASGKTVTLNAILKDKDQPYYVSGLKRLLSTTARPLRVERGEVDGVDYNFITPEQFEQEKNSGNLLENILYAGHPYGLRKRDIKEALSVGGDSIVILDKEGLAKIKEFCEEKNIISIFFHRDLAAMEEEINQRPISERDREFRRQRNLEDMKEKDNTDYVVYNDGSLTNLYLKVANIIRVCQENNKPSAEIY